MLPDGIDAVAVRPVIAYELDCAVVVDVEMDRDWDVTVAVDGVGVGVDGMVVVAPPPHAANAKACRGQNDDGVRQFNDTIEEVWLSAFKQFARHGEISTPYRCLLMKIARSSVASGTTAISIGCCLQRENGQPRNIGRPFFMALL